jgi:NAD(P)-dependent dehydrogenase (short-subunit alcohol dehydrogenase family)
VLDQHGRLDILVNNAGITIDKTARKMSASDWDRVIAINLSGARIVLHLALELKRRGGGVGAAALCGGSGQGDALILRVPA